MNKPGSLFKVKSFLKEHRLTILSNPYFYLFLVTHILISIYTIPENGSTPQTSPSAVRISQIWSIIALSLLFKDFEKRTLPKTFFVNSIPAFLSNLVFWALIQFTGEIKQLLFR